MSHSAYPVDSDYTTFFTNSGQPLPSGYSATGVGAMVSAMFEQALGLVPFLQDASPSLRYYNPPGVSPNNRTSGLAPYGGGRILNLDAALVSASSIVSVVVSGQSMVFNTDYVLKPQNAQANKRPYTRINFLNPVWGQANSIIINAQWGAQAALSEDVWQGLLRWGGSIIAKDVLEGIRTGTLGVKQGDENFTFSPVLLAGLGETWMYDASRMLAPYKLVEVGIV